MAPKDHKYYQKNREELQRKSRERARAKWLRMKQDNGTQGDVANAQSHQVADAGQDVASNMTSPNRAYNANRPPTPKSDPLLLLLDDFWYQPQLPSVDRLLVSISHDLKDLQVKMPSRPHYNNYIGLREDVSCWVGAFGGMLSWQVSLDVLFTRAIQTSHSLVMDLVERLWLHQAHGKVLLRRLQEIDGFLLQNPTAVAMLWSYQQALVIDVVKGLTILEVKLPVMHSTTLLSINTNANSLTMIRGAQAIFRSKDGEISEDYNDTSLPLSDEE